jgi:hypothetical protein
VSSKFKPPAFPNAAGNKWINEDGEERPFAGPIHDYHFQNLSVNSKTAFPAFYFYSLRP